jgi:hypothetical protein
MLNDAIKFPRWKRAPLMPINTGQETNPFTRSRPGNIASLLRVDRSSL